MNEGKIARFCMTNEEKLLDDIHTAIENQSYTIRSISTDRALLNKLIEILVKKDIITDKDITGLGQL